jgi:hypothetical protein
MIRNLIEKLTESCEIWLLCNTSEVSFAVGLEDGTIKTYSRNSNNQKYEMTKEYKYHPVGVDVLLYLPKQNCLLSVSKDGIFNVLSLSEGKSIKTLSILNDWIFGLISLNDETFANANFGQIKIWSIKEDIQYLKTIKAHNDRYPFIFLYLLGKDLMVSRSKDEFIIWDVKNYNYSKTYKEDSFIQRLIVTGENNIITVTDRNKVNLWKILV